MNSSVYKNAHVSGFWLHRVFIVCSISFWSLIGFETQPGWFPESFASSSDHFPSVLCVKSTIILLGLLFREVAFLSDSFVCKKPGSPGSHGQSSQETQWLIAQITERLISLRDEMD